MLMPHRKKVRVWNKGQVTIPKHMRKSLEIADESILNIVQIGNVIFLCK
jgi:AbrB family looped-hinge helix DNA binding protein